MSSRVRGVIGVVLALLGSGWILQGTNLLPGTLMSGQPVYALLGAVVLLIGVALAWRSFMRSEGRS